MKNEVDLLIGILTLPQHFSSSSPSDFLQSLEKKIYLSSHNQSIVLWHFSDIYNLSWGFWKDICSLNKRGGWGWYHAIFSLFFLSRVWCCSCQLAKRLKMLIRRIKRSWVHDHITMLSHPPWAFYHQIFAMREKPTQPIFTYTMPSWVFCNTPLKKKKNLIW